MTTPGIAFISSSFDMRPLAGQLQSLRPDWKVLVWPDDGWDQAEVAVCWNTPPGVYARMPRLALVHGIAAGIDNIVEHHDLRETRVCRVIDTAQTRGMVEYIQWGVTYFQRDFDRVLAQQARSEWKRPVLRAAEDCRVGIMGLGATGATVAQSLAANGYRVSGFCRTPRSVEGVETFAGDAQWAPFLSSLNILVCMLPLTPATRHVLGRKTFDLLPRGTGLIHAGRGEQLVPEDLRDAIASGQLRGAIIDVFPQEPLPPDDSLWRTPGIVVTPHMATMASTKVILSQIVGNVERLGSGEALVNAVDVSKY
ncbi:Glyoxylate/hydroxypyruvate reductase A [Variovorax sp. PBS-H4]|uniref:2-hydroxyacid dehydrogenase n=1 Tax=Variovorax sp. PBS-H4 TaxID=434008 RepID=UPI00131748DB|nr:glyoxylate/hydroxypyruvate reductase A [Variovorax sp. PBS-H4]VTU37578.1 Glyoxylate/hydroxypyruvate reductase A [Variovorax sp. PBS-H4]